MADVAELATEHPKLVDNITHFARALRRAGLAVGPGRVVDAVRAVEAAGFQSRQDFYWALHGCFVTRPEDRMVFQQVFRLFWRDPRYLEHMMAAMLPAIRGTQPERKAQAGAKRASQALLDDAPPLPPEPESEDSEIEMDASATMSGEERLRQLDFEQMSPEEMAQARRVLASLTLPVPPLLTRRHQPAAQGAQLDWRRTMHRACRTGGEVARMSYTRAQRVPPDLVVLCDISGSMSHYSRMVLHFLHALSNQHRSSASIGAGRGWGRVHGFTFGTQLTNITRHLVTRDVDQALAAAGAEAQDWQGGTRIGKCLGTFNRRWARRVLGQRSMVLLVTDGLDREAPEQLGFEMQRLHLSCRHLLWLNPLLRWQGFAPRATGIRAMLPHVDGVRAGHNIASLADLAAALSQGTDKAERDRLAQML